jgi:CelD/BcsL family acetyltransferase involved in cellulose biosynthesis
METTTSTAWARRKVGLRYMLGEWPMFQVQLPMWRHETHFTTLDEHPDDAKLTATLTDDVVGLLVRSHPLRHPLPRFERVQGLLRYVPAHYTHYVTDLRDPWETYLARFSKGKLKNIQRNSRKMDELPGGVEFREFRQPEQMEELYELSRTVSVKSYQERLLGVGFPAGQAWRDSMLRRAVLDGVRGWAMLHNDTPIAYHYTHLDAGVVKSMFLGYDPDYAKLSPGTVLHYRLLQQLMDEGGYRMFDHGQGEGSHKQLFATDGTLCADLYYVRPTLRLQTLIRLHDATNRFSTAVGQRLAKLGVKEKIKKLMRKAA